MKAAVVTDFTRPLELQDRPVPEPGPGEVLVRMEACGLCHTDIHAAHGDWPVKPTPPPCTRTAAPGSSRRPRKLDQVNESIDDVLAGRTPARLVFKL